MMRTKAKTFALQSVRFKVSRESGDVFSCHAISHNYRPHKRASIKPIITGTSTTQQTRQNSKTFPEDFHIEPTSNQQQPIAAKSNPAQHGRPPPRTPISGLVEAERHRRGLTRLAGEVSRLSGRLWSTGAGVSQPRVYRVLSRGGEGCGRRRENSRLG